LFAVTASTGLVEPAAPQRSLSIANPIGAMVAAAVHDARRMAIVECPPLDGKSGVARRPLTLLSENCSQFGTPSVLQNAELSRKDVTVAGQLVSSTKRL
jgi:hypothetical protein